MSTRCRSSKILYSKNTKSANRTSKRLEKCLPKRNLLCRFRETWVGHFHWTTSLKKRTKGMHLWRRCWVRFRVMTRKWTTCKEWISSLASLLCTATPPPPFGCLSSWLKNANSEISFSRAYLAWPNTLILFDSWSKSTSHNFTSTLNSST